MTTRSPVIELRQITKTFGNFTACALLSKEPATQAEEIKQRLYNAALEERYGRWLREDLRKKHHVETLE